MRREPREPWASAMRAAGFVYGDRPSVRQLWQAAEKLSGVEGFPSLETVRQTVILGRRPRTDSLEVIAKALKVPAAEAAGWAGYDRELSAPYRPPAEANLLNDRERAALDDLIRVMAAGKLARPLVDDEGEVEVVRSGDTVTARKKVTRSSHKVSGR